MFVVVNTSHSTPVALQLERGCLLTQSTKGNTSCLVTRKVPPGTRFSMSDSGWMGGIISWSGFSSYFFQQ